MWRGLYRVLWWFAPPVIRRYLRRRARGNAAYLEHWDERFGVPKADVWRDVIWIHAVSVGETNAALPIVRALQTRLPESRFLITQMTPTGRDTAQRLFPEAQCRYLPYDKPEYVRQFLDEHAPRIGVFMETEIWANLLHACAQRRIPTVLANARLSEKSLRGYVRAAGLFRPAFAALSLVLAQTEADKTRLETAGARLVAVSGNSKYDLPPNAAAQATAELFRQRIGQRPVVVCGSTREKNGTDEAQLLLDAWRQHDAGHALLVIVPRHPERFQAAFEAAQQAGFTAQKRSDNAPVAADTQVWIGDSMGELFAYYLCADIAFVGGSLVDTGCQNVIEPIACGVPTLFGFSTYNFAAACAAAAETGAARQVHTAEEWAQVCHSWLGNDAARHSVVGRARGFIARHAGASEKMADAMVHLLQSAA
ncbi:MAG: lipid IV(A) 3-deoxy-D-manno-octulosonic acid transferase [Neisseria sp.]|nr:lipid IV(A) 3-deoxy-D-manno-octulosonic acid transferase [Neisseria sp.]